MEYGSIFFQISVVSSESCICAECGCGTSVQGHPRSLIVLFRISYRSHGLSHIINVYMYVSL